MKKSRELLMEWRLSMADPLFGVGLVVLTVTAVRDRLGRCPLGHDYEELAAGKIRGHVWKKGPSDSAVLLRCKRCGKRQFACA